MRTTIRKVFWAWEFEEEEKWLADMAAQGKALVSARFFTYEFEDSEPGEYAVRLEMLDHMPDSPEGQRYIAFVEETGAEYIGKVMKWVYFRKKTALGEFELHGDNATRMKHLKGIINLLKPLMVVNIGAGMYNLVVFLSYRNGLNLLAVLLSAGVAGFLFRGITLLNQRKDRLERESQLFE